MILYFCQMDVPIIDGKLEHRRKLASFQEESYDAACEILKGLSKDIAMLGYNILPVVAPNGKMGLTLAPMELEEYVTFSKTIVAQKEEAKPDQTEGQVISE